MLTIWPSILFAANVAAPAPPMPLVPTLQALSASHPPSALAALQPDLQELAKAELRRLLAAFPATCGEHADGPIPRERTPDGTAAGKATQRLRSLQWGFEVPRFFDNPFAPPVPPTPPWPPSPPPSPVSPPWPPPSPFWPPNSPPKEHSILEKIVPDFLKTTFIFIGVWGDMLEYEEEVLTAWAAFQNFILVLVVAYFLIKIPADALLIITLALIFLIFLGNPVGIFLWLGGLFVDVSIKFPIFVIATLYVCKLLSSTALQNIMKRLGMDKDGDGDVDFMDLIHHIEHICGRGAREASITSVAWLSEKASRRGMVGTGRRLDELEERLRRNGKEAPSKKVTLNKVFEIVTETHRINMSRYGTMGSIRHSRKSSEEQEIRERMSMHGDLPNEPSTPPGRRGSLRKGQLVSSGSGSPTERQPSPPTLDQVRSDVTAQTRTRTLGEKGDVYQGGSPGDML